MCKHFRYVVDIDCPSKNEKEITLMVTKNLCCGFQVYIIHLQQYLCQLTVFPKRNY
jgi:hypothetical protein